MATRQIPAAVALAVVLMAPAGAAAQTPPRSQETAPVNSGTGVDAEIGSLDLRQRDVASFVGLFKGLHRDFARLASSNNVVITTMGAFGAMAGHAVDRQVADSNWGQGTAREIFGPGEIAGGAVVQATAALGTYAAGRVFKQPRVARLGGELIRAQLVAQAVTQTIKLSARRTRPDGATLSFPSGHTSATFATATVLQREFGWKTGVPAYAVASWVAASRMHAERHYLSDVVMGATIGILAGRAVTVGANDRRFAISPVAVPGGAGVNIVRVQ